MEEQQNAPLRVLAGLPMYNEKRRSTVITNVKEHIEQVICVDDSSSDSS